MKVRGILVALACANIVIASTGCDNHSARLMDPTSRAVKYIEELSGKDCELVSKELCTK